MATNLGFEGKKKEIVTTRKINDILDKLPFILIEFQKGR
jgi:hypothetical protein